MAEDGESWPTKEYVEEIVAWLEGTVGIPESFFSERHRDDDWTFIIRLHAMIESGLNHLFTEHFKTPELARIFARLETSNPRTGKIAFLKACAILSETQMSFVKQISEIRNFIVHDIKNFRFNLKDHIGKMDKVQLRIWLDAIKSTRPRSPDEEAAADAALRDPIWAIKSTALAIMGEAFATGRLNVVNAQLGQLQLKLSQMTQENLEKARLRIAELEREAPSPKE